MYVCGPNDIIYENYFLYTWLCNKNYYVKIIMVVIDFINSASEQLANIFYQKILYL